MHEPREDGRFGELNVLAAIDAAVIHPQPIRTPLCCGAGDVESWQVRSDAMVESDPCQDRTTPAPI